MFTNMTFTHRLAVPFGIAVVILVLIVGLAYWATDSLVANDQAVEHTIKVRNVLSNLKLDLETAVSAQRGYLLTGQDSYTGSYQDATNQVKSELQKFQQLTTDNADQQRRAEAMAPLLDKRLALLSTHLEQRRAQGLDAAVQAVTSDGGQEVMNVHPANP